MKNKNLAPILKSNIDQNSSQFLENKEVMLNKLEFLDGLLDQVELGGGKHHHERLAKRGKMPVRERVMKVLDPDTPFLEISPFAAYGTDYTVGGGCVSGVGVIAGVECVVFANDPSVKAGAMTVYVGEKWARAIEIARVNQIPFISFVESAGGDLSMGTGSKSGQAPIAPTLHTTHFAATGRFFYEMTELSKLRIPVISVVFGSSTAGGAYQPGMSDYNIFIKDQSKVFLAGPPLVKMATGEESDDETLGGAKMHSETSGLSDYLAEDEMDALRICREIVSHLNWEKKGLGPIKESKSPKYDQDDLLGLISEDLKSPVDIREIISRVTDGSQFEEFKPLYGQTMICGWACIHGYQVGVLGNNGPIYPECAEKAASFIQLCNKRDIPLIFLQNVTGFLVGKDFERQAIIKKGSQMINAVSNSTVPHITIIVGASYGAGTYAMSGRAYNNRFTFLWPTAKIAVMGPEQIAGVMSIVRKAKAMRTGEKFDEKAASFIQLCNKRDIPLIFLQNVTGFLVGKDFERQAIIKKGSQMINAVSNSTVPHITIIVGASYGAGTYAMSGRAYNNRFTFLWPTAKIAVMGPEQIAGVMSIVRKAKAMRTGEKFDEKADAEIVKMVEDAAERMSHALVASSMLTDDGIIDPRDTRKIIAFCLSICNNTPIEGAKEYGVFRL